jgi:hypothetical protein
MRAELERAWYLSFPARTTTRSIDRALSVTLAALPTSLRDGALARPIRTMEDTQISDLDG